MHKLGTTAPLPPLPAFRGCCTASGRECRAPSATVRGSSRSRSRLSEGAPCSWDVWSARAPDGPAGPSPPRTLPPPSKRNLQSAGLGPGTSGSGCNFRPAPRRAGVSTCVRALNPRTCTKHKCKSRRFVERRAGTLTHVPSHNTHKSRKAAATQVCPDGAGGTRVPPDNGHCSALSPKGTLAPATTWRDQRPPCQVKRASHRRRNTVRFHFHEAPGAPVRRDREREGVPGAGAGQGTVSVWWGQSPV